MSGQWRGHNAQGAVTAALGAVAAARAVPL